MWRHTFMFFIFIENYVSYKDVVLDTTFVYSEQGLSFHTVRSVIFEHPVHESEKKKKWKNERENQL